MHWLNNPNMHRIRLPPHLPWVWQWRGWFVVTCQGKSFPCTNQAFLVSHMPAKQTRILPFWRPIETTEVSLVKPLNYSLSVAEQILSLLAPGAFLFPCWKLKTLKIRLYFYSLLLLHRLCSLSTVRRLLRQLCTWHQYFCLEFIWAPLHWQTSNCIWHLHFYQSANSSPISETWGRK